MHNRKHFLLILAIIVIIGMPSFAKNAINNDWTTMDPQWGTTEVKKIDACLRLPKPLKRTKIGKESIGIDFIIDRNGAISKFKARPYNSKWYDIPESTFLAVEEAMIEAIKCSKIRGPKLPYQSFYGVYHLNRTESFLCCDPVCARDVMTRDGLIARDPKWGSEEVKKIDACLQIPPPVKRTELGIKVLRIDFIIDGNGVISSLKADSYDEHYYAKSGIPKSTYLAITGAMIEAIKCSKIRGPQLPGGPYNASYDLGIDSSDLSVHK
jgi:hypothetical protein